MLAFKLAFNIGFLYLVPIDADITELIRISNLLVRKHIRSLGDLEGQIKLMMMAGRQPQERRRMAEKEKQLPC